VEESHNESAQTVALYRKLAKKEPHDAEARIFLANALGDGFDDNGDPKPGMKRKDRDPRGRAQGRAQRFCRESLLDSCHGAEQSPGARHSSAALLASLAPPAATWCTCPATFITG